MQTDIEQLKQEVVNLNRLVIQLTSRVLKLEDEKQNLKSVQPVRPVPAFSRKIKTVPTESKYKILADGPKVQCIDNEICIDSRLMNLCTHEFSEFISGEIIPYTEYTLTAFTRYIVFGEIPRISIYKVNEYFNAIDLVKKYFIVKDFPVDLYKESVKSHIKNCLIDNAQDLERYLKGLPADFTIKYIRRERKKLSGTWLVANIAIEDNKICKHMLHHLDN